MQIPMIRERIVLETSDQRKSALVRALGLQGESLSDWFEEQLTLNIPEANRTLSDDVKPIPEPSALADASEVLRDLSKLDWAFTDDDTRYLTHDLHPYPAKFIPQIPARLVARLSAPGDLVLDPFGGSGTTAVEAARMGRRALSLDANELSALIGRVKTGFMTPAVRSAIDQLHATVASYVISEKPHSADWSESLIRRYAELVPSIPNIERWFSPVVLGELALLRFLIGETTEGLARDAALLAMSRIVTRVSNQESETRYVAEPKSLPTGLTLRAYLESLQTIARRLESAAPTLQYADTRFVVADSRRDIASATSANSVDLIVTSPPYPNATDYHLYHRFRLFWLGFDPRKLGTMEIGSHLRHQRNGTGFDEYEADMREVLAGCAQVLQPGRYAVFVIGDALFKGRYFSTYEALKRLAVQVGFESIGVIERQIHQTKRSFAKPARRARREQIAVFRKPDQTASVRLYPPRYKMWRYEEGLRRCEIQALAGVNITPEQSAKVVEITAAQPALWNLRRLVFTSEYAIGQQARSQPTWQRALENGDAEAGRRKDPKYATHGIHSFKGKFYPQLSKALINISGAPINGRILDPYCGSGTALLEGMLNGYATFGCDLNPLAAKIARAKTGIYALDRAAVEQSIRSTLDRVAHQTRTPSVDLDQFPFAIHEELNRWFPSAVLRKVNWLLSQVRLFGEPVLVDFFEVIISSLIRDVSQQDPTDLRIRRRKILLEDAPVLELFRTRLEQQYKRLISYWTIAGRRPGPLVTPIVVVGDCRDRNTYEALGLQSDSADCAVTSPPYATALPYIDTDRLSLLAIMGISSISRSSLEEGLTGSREIRRADRQFLESQLFNSAATDSLPQPVIRDIRAIHTSNRKIGVGFRRENMAALLWRYFTDIRRNLSNVREVLKTGAKAYYVVGDSRTKAGNTWVSIKTGEYICQVADMVGFKVLDSIPIDVTTENYKHIRNAITKNVILTFQKA